jgi:TATA-binding protein-associated factor
MEDKAGPQANGKSSKAAAAAAVAAADLPKGDEMSKHRLARRGAGLAFGQLSAKFKDDLFVVIPNMWQHMAGGLSNTFTTDSVEDSDSMMDKQSGQDVIDSLSVLEAVMPSVHEGLWPKICETFPMMLLALRSRYAIIRQSAARCLSVVCDVMTSPAMLFVIEKVLPLLADPLNLANRQGAIELVYRRLIFFLLLIFSLFLQISSRNWMSKLFPMSSSSSYQSWVE